MQNETIPKYALIDDHEVFLIESIRHALSDDVICVFKDEEGTKRYIPLDSWVEGAEEFSRYAEKQHIVTSESSSKEKINLFKSLFRGRTDVYAHGYINHNGKMGYFPACKNERTNRCPRWNGSDKAIKCAKCSMRNLLQLDDKTILNHFKGIDDACRDVLGLYVLLTDGTTWMLIADFDGMGWKDEAILYRDTCKDLGFTPAVERSRSGNGAHVWLFFDEAIDAKRARDLGSTIITYAMNKGNMRFEAYDRLFPVQTTIPDGGFGNLIALPFQGHAMKGSNSLFVDDDFKPYPDQWRYLSTLTRVSEKQIQNVLDNGNHEPLGKLEFNPNGRRGLLKDKVLFNNSIYDEELAVKSDDFRERVLITKKNMLIVNKRGISGRALNSIKRLAAFSNPEFYRAQAMHQSVYGKQRIIWCGEDDPESILLPRGCEEKLTKLINDSNASYYINDCRRKSDYINVEFLGTLRSSQQEAADTLLAYENGVLSAPTGFGKTVIGAYIIAKLKVRTLIIVPKSNLVRQWEMRLQEFLSITDDRPPLLTKSGRKSKRKRKVIGIIAGGKCAPSGIIDVATFQSLAERNDLGALQAKPIVNDYDLVICDECHYAAAPNFENVLKNVFAKYVYGLSATPRRSDGLEGIIFLQCGPIRYSVDPRRQMAEQGFSRSLIPRFTRIRLTLEQGSSYNQVVDALCKHDARNRLIIEDTVNAISKGRTPLIISKRKSHAKILANKLSEIGIRNYLLIGEGTARERRRLIDEVKAQVNTDYAIVATGSYIGEGFDLPRLDTLLLACPYSWEGVITQYSGRLHRDMEGKRDVIVYDYVDTSSPMLERMYKRRLKTYAKLGYEVREEVTNLGPNSRLVTYNEWKSTFVSDLNSCDKRILISAPYVNIAFVKSIVTELSEAVSRGVSVDVILRLQRDIKIDSTLESADKLLSNAGCQVAVRETPLTGLAIFDGKVVWYGTIPLLAYAKADDCSLRIVNAEAAEDLEKTLESLVQ